MEYLCSYYTMNSNIKDLKFWEIEAENSLSAAYKFFNDSNIFRETSLVAVISLESRSLFEFKTNKNKVSIICHKINEYMTHSIYKEVLANNAIR